MSSNFISRKINNIVTNGVQSDGAGVKVRRSIGTSPVYFDPFALFDNALFDKGSYTKNIHFPPHIHRGIATLSIMLKGYMQHNDHKGHAGILSPGDVQYMCAGRGIVHSEVPITNQEVSALQLWVNLRKEDKMCKPAYQEYKSAQIPEIHTDDGVYAKVITGAACGLKAKIHTSTPIHVIHYKLQPGAHIDHVVPRHWNAFIYCISGHGFAGPSSQNASDEEQGIKQYQTAFFNAEITGSANSNKNNTGNNKDKSETNDHQQDDANIKDNENNDNDNNNNSNEQQQQQLYGISINAAKNKTFEFVLIAGEPLNEQIVVQSGPIIMNSKAQIEQAFADFRAGKNGFQGAQEFIRNWQRPPLIEGEESPETHQKGRKGKR